MKLTIPELSLVALVGVSGCGKSTFARTHFSDTEVLSSDACRALVSDDPDDQEATADAFDVLAYIAGKRLARKRLTVVDATNVEADARKPLIALAREHHVVPVAIVLDLPLGVCSERNAARSDRNLPQHVLRRQRDQLKRGLRGLKREGFRTIHVLTSAEQVGAVQIQRTRPWTDRSDERGPFDIIGDVHGCFDEMVDLLTTLGYGVTLNDGDGAARRHRAHHPDGRRAIFVGDLVDRGPATPDVLRLAMGMAERGSAIVLPGNHEDKLVRALRGRKVNVSHGLAQSLEQLDAEPAAFRDDVAAFLHGLVSHFVLDGGALVVAHAGMPEELAGRASRKVRDFALYGETTGETDEYGLRVRYQWAADYRGSAAVVYGHTPVPRAEWLNNTICVDTGCVFGGALTALRWPERELVSVPARRQHYAPVRPLGGEDATGERPAGDPRSLQQRHDDVLDVADVLGKRQVATELMGRVTIRAEQATAALEPMSRFGIDPRWLIHLPPTMPPAGTAASGDLLEHPDLAWEFYRRAGVRQVVCETKHMGSRALIVVARDERVARERFGATDGRDGAVFTRRGRSFFPDPASERDVLAHIRDAAGRAGLWDELATGWLCVDAEIMPWNLKAEELVREHYAAVGAAGRAFLHDATAVLERITARAPEAAVAHERFTRRAAALERYADAYRPYCWEVDGLAGVRIAPFHLLASEGTVHHQRDHGWHLDVLGRLADADGDLLCRTAARTVDLDDSAATAAATEWWEQATASGAEGMVVKPLAFTVRGSRGLVQPAVKVRGREYLRIIYGPEYTLALDRLRDRALGRKRSLALREFALGVEALRRFVARRPLREVHQAVFGVLALDSDPVDPRL